MRSFQSLHCQSFEIFHLSFVGHMTQKGSNQSLEFLGVLLEAARGTRATIIRFQTFTNNAIFFVNSTTTITSIKFTSNKIVNIITITISLPTSPKKIYLSAYNDGLWPVLLYFDIYIYTLKCKCRFWTQLFCAVLISLCSLEKACRLTCTAQAHKHHTKN